MVRALSIPPVEANHWAGVSHRAGRTNKGTYLYSLAVTAFLCEGEAWVQVLLARILGILCYTVVS